MTDRHAGIVARCKPDQNLRPAPCTAGLESGRAEHQPRGAEARERDRGEHDRKVALQTSGLAIATLPPQHLRMKPAIMRLGHDLTARLASPFLPSPLSGTSRLLMAHGVKAE